MLYCGAGIRPAADALVRMFEERHNVAIDTTYAGSGRLLAQMAASRTGDLFMPGAELYVDMAVEKGLAVASGRRTVAFFIPVIFVQKGNPKAIRSLRDLARDGLRVGLGDERACAVGKVALAIFKKNGIEYAELEKNVVYKSGTVNELGVAVQLGSVDAVIIWDANARHFAAYGEAIAIPPRQNVISTLPIIMLKSSRHVAESQDFIDFVTSEDGRHILAEKGYTVSLPER